MNHDEDKTPLLDDHDGQAPDMDPPQDEVQDPQTDPQAEGDEGEESACDQEESNDAASPSSAEEAGPSLEAYEALKTQYTRLLADFDNYKRRIRRDQADTLNYATAGLVEELLPVLDTLEMAMASLPEDAGDQLQAFGQGTEKIYKQLFDILAKAGLQKIEADCAPFDPEYHEAVMMVDTDEVPAQHIAEVLRPGYSFKDKVLRPTVCKVAQG